MARHGRPNTPGRATLTVAAALSTAALAAGTAQAVPGPDPKEAEEKVDALYEEAEVATDKYNGAVEMERKLQQEADRAQERAARGQERLNKLRRGLGALAASQYRSGGLDPSVQLLLSSDPDEYLEKAAALDRLSGQQAARFAELAEQARIQQQIRTQAAAKLRDLEEARRKAAERKADVTGKLREAKALFNSLEADEQAEIEAEDAREREQAVATRDAERPALSGVSPRAETAVQAAYDQLGKPYVWGASGPGSFDCSGLTQYVWRQAGVSLPRTTYDQVNAGTRVDKSQLQPGDLVFYYPDLTHVAIYIGDGKLIDAPRPGKSVQIIPVEGNGMPYATAVRPS